MDAQQTFWPPHEEKVGDVTKITLADGSISGSENQMAKQLPGLDAELRLGLVFAVPGLATSTPGREESARPGINRPFKKPNVKKYIGKFEVESREVFAQRREIVAACKLRTGMVIADIGAGTGLFTLIFAKKVGRAGKVYAVDIAPKFVEHIATSCKEKGITNVVAVVCTQTSAELPRQSIDLAFICDTYHHFEFPAQTMASIHRALRPGGQVVLIDFKRIEGRSPKWVLGHVRAGQEVFTREIVSAGFKVIGEQQSLKKNYFVQFQKVGTGQQCEQNEGTSPIFPPVGITKRQSPPRR